VLIGPTSAVFVVARQSFLAQVVPVDQRARAMSSLGGVARIGWFIGPLLAAPLIATHGAKASFLVLAGAGVAAAALTWWSMDLPDLVPGATTGNPVPVPVSQTVRRHLRIFLTVGIGVLIIGLARSARLTVVPLWSEHVGLSASQVSLLFSLSYGLEMLLFFPAGWVMDRFGRVWVAVPVAVVLGAALLLLPLATTLTGVAVAALAMGLANGMGSGIVMTLGADLAPADGRAAFLGVWRWLSLIGTNSAALIVAGIAAAVGLGAASVVVGALSLLGGGWLWRWVPAHDPRRQRQT
jgi:MFS family permease